MDASYITDWSLGLDLKILMKTVKVVLAKEGAPNGLDHRQLGIKVQIISFD